MPRPWHAPHPVFKTSKDGTLTCRSCGQAPYRCWYCSSPTCLPCAQTDRCSCCQRLVQ